MPSIEEVRDELLPALFDVFGQTDINGEIIVDGNHLIVKASKRGKEDSPLGFALTAETIEDGRYKAIFSPACLKLREVLENGD